MDPGPHRAQGAVDYQGDLLVAHALDETQQQDLALVRLELGQGGMDLFRLLGREIDFALLPTRRVNVFELLGELPSLPQRAQRSVPCDLVEPGAEGTGSGQLGDAFENLQP